MTFSLTRPSSPSHELHNTSNTSNEDDTLSSALHAALSSFVPNSSAHSHSADHDMGKDKERSSIDIVVDANCITVRGTGAEVQPALLSGHVALNLTESTSIKEITLQFRGKVRLPAPMNEQRALNNSPQTYTICTHDWSFLEGEKRHSHTLKAGRHLFPFQLQLGGSLPSCVATSAHGGVIVSYKLRAVAVRPGLAHNMQAAIPIFLLHSFAPEALEFQQTLEIENSWPEKLMYSIVLPHKVWAIGDILTVVVKFSPLAKGVRVLTVHTQIIEITKVHCRGATHEHTRKIATAEHTFSGGRAVPKIEQHYGEPAPIVQGSDTPSPPNGLSNEDHISPASMVGQNDASLAARSPVSGSSSSLDASPPVLASASGGSSSTEGFSAEADHMGPADVVTQLSLTIPRSATPSHLLEPIVVSHRVRWSILMSNLDGHTSELRCSLPIHILDHRLLDESRANSATTRRLILGGSEIPLEEEQDAELPSYPSHVRDRVPNVYHPEVRLTNHLGTQPSEGCWTPPISGSPRAPTIPHLPCVPQADENTPLEWINSELLLSMSRDAPPQTPNHPSPSHSEGSSRAASRPSSRVVSRRGSRAPSPERHLTMTSISGTHIGNGLGSNSTSCETYVHSSQASRSLPGIFSMSMKPATHGWRPSRPSSYTNIAGALSSSSSATPTTTVPGPTGHYAHATLPLHSSTPVMATPAADVTADVNESTMRALMEVPDYGASASGIIGGVPPLTSMQGLPSYEEAERSSGHESSETALLR
ncbi:hypothetical protein EDC04DRAFT_2126164 [Pisolithus marmoratus]|nr:hypothetical protein EDC04DRAFT_2126164 [Pisolithus marmoratus]